MNLNDSSSQYENLPLRFQTRRVQPREDEGREALPAYSTAINLNNVLKRKMEFQNAVERASSRNWHRVGVSLQGTALKIYKPNKSMFRLKYASQDSISKILIRSYNLQHAQVGVATDYAKKKHVIRIRVETEQFLLSCDKIENLVQWTQSLGAAIDLATPLDDRDYPQEFYMPRRNRRARSSSCSLRTVADRRVATTSPQISSRTRILPNSHLRPSSNSRSCPRNGEDNSSLNFSICSTYLATIDLPCPQSGESLNTSQSNKWRPYHQWSPSYDMIYAKRCLAVLTSCMPRKSNIVIVNGEFYVVDWGTGNMSKFNYDVTPNIQNLDVASSFDAEFDVKSHLELPPEYEDLEKLKL